jgi:RNA polymerase sigma-70 factor (ECF subfamily)
MQEDGGDELPGMTGRLRPGKDAVFMELRPLLVAIAYRMLGSSTEADDAVQDAYLRWDRTVSSAVSSPRAYLTTTVTRLCIDRLRSARARRESYPGPWLPDPVPTEELDPASSAELADSLSMAFLVLLEELGPVERAAFLLHDVFRYSYSEIAATIGRNEANCRQLVARARHRIAERKHRFDADVEYGQQMTRRFLVACATGDVSGLMSMLAEDVVVWTDGGGKVRAAPRPIFGPARAARFLVNVTKKGASSAEAHELSLNGQPGLVLLESGKVTSAVVLDIFERRITGVRVVSNPEKLKAVQPLTQ